jgi:HD-GYP domain-containing protein (c-di-GMP phosphodiesterase class II)
VIPNATRRAKVPPLASDAQEDAIARLLDLVTESAPEVAAHMERTARLASALVQHLELGDPLSRLIVLTARLHDVGKLRVPPWILEKNGPLTESELGLMQEHPVMGQDMLERRSELLAIGPLVRATHERWDGTGYPDGLRGPAVPLPSRIVAVCDAFDAMTKPRVYSDSMSIRASLDELEAWSGSQFDPGVVAVFSDLVESRFDRRAKEA